MRSAPSIIADEEKIARVIFSPSMIVNGKVAPTAFQLRNLRKPEDYVSVFRNDYVEITQEYVSVVHPPCDNYIYGYALLNVGECRKIAYEGITTEVKSHATKNNPFHAGIHFSNAGTDIKGNCIDPNFMMVMTMLANRCSLVAF